MGLKIPAISKNSFEFWQYCVKIYSNVKKFRATHQFLFFKDNTRYENYPLRIDPKSPQKKGEELSIPEI